MRCIQKSENEPTSFASWKAQTNENWQPTFENMNSTVKQELKTALSDEQLGICCYCESKLTETDSHIEHFRPQGRFPDRSLDYTNLLCSCQSNLKKGKPRHCGSAKADWFDSNLISPLQENCSSYFNFTGDGHIYPAVQGAAQETIACLALDIPKLVSSRKEVLDVFLDENISDADFVSFFKKYITSLSSSNPPEYISAVTQVFSPKPPQPRSRPSSP